MKITASNYNLNVISILGNAPYIIGDYQFWENEETGELWRRKFDSSGKSNHGKWELR
jgi:hypothetical protein